MGQLDKKVLKFLKSRQDDDLDAGDIAISLRCDEDEVQEALDSLKVQGLAESVVRNGKTYWEQSLKDPLGDDDDPLGSDAPDEINADTASWDLSKINPPAKPINEPAPRLDNPAFDAPSFSAATQIAPKLTSTDDVELDGPPANGISPTIGIIIAVVASVLISAIVTGMMMGGTKKGISDAVQSMERTTTALQTKYDQRIDELSAKINVLSEKALSKPPVIKAVPVVQPVHKVSAKQTVRPAQKAKPKPAPKAPVKATHVSKKKKDNKGIPAYFNPPEATSSSGSSNTSSSSASSSSSSSSPSPSPSPSSPPPSSSSSSSSWEPPPSSSSSSTPGYDDQPAPPPSTGDGGANQ
jgi:hypothetical protein